MKIYLAGPISGKSFAEVVSLYKKKSFLFESFGYSILCPMTGKSYLRNEIEFKSEGLTHPTATNHAIFERDRWMVSQSDVVLADLSNSGERVSIGTMMELAWASQLGKHTVSVIPQENIHNHAFVLEASDITFQTLEEAIVYLKELIKGVMD